jgi:hypothetical protein
LIARLVVAAAILAVALAVAWKLRRGRSEPPVRDTYPVPRQLDRTDFPGLDSPWLVAYFSSTTCDSCRGLGPKVVALASAAVSVCEISFESGRELHERYEIAAIPMILITDGDGVVRRAFVGATTATDLWAAVAELREPGVTTEPDLGRL